jgi:cation diffusion facilitator CzcD-associated flavoprotein CzcO
MQAVDGSPAAAEPLEVPVLVIGAGPAGLAVAGCLARRGLRAEVLEAGAAVGTSWRAHYRRLRLHTVKEHSALPHHPFPAHYPRYVAREQMVDYLEDHARTFGLQPRLGEEADTITRQGGRWLTRCTSGRAYLSPAVVLATGANRRPRRPHFPGEDAFLGEIVHSADYLDPQPYAGRRVLVVGMGNTGAEIALDLATRGVQATLAVRSPINIVRRDVLGRPTQLTALALTRLPTGLADLLARWFRDWTVGDLRAHGLETSRTSPLRQLREEGRTPVIDVGTVDSIRRGEIAVRPGLGTFTATGVRFADGREEDFDAVILATGYHADIARLFPKETLAVDDKGLPSEVVGSGRFAGIYFVGYDIRQGGGLLRCIGQQAVQVADAIVPAAPGRQQET